MEVKIEVRQEIVNGSLGPKKYDLSVVIPYGTGSVHWKKDAHLFGLDAETVKELIPLLTREMENALKV